MAVARQVMPADCVCRKMLPLFVPSNPALLLMTLREFKTSLRNPHPPSRISPLLRALWFDANGDWQAAHTLAQDVDSPEGAWVHGYLHRKEGDLQNAAYWYRRAARDYPGETLGKEWDIIARDLLDRMP
jgi:hypothetical protein